MPATAITYPEWVQKHRVRGTTIKKKGNSYYLYKRTSKRVPGKKYPQAVDTYIGLITPEGVVYSDKKKVTLSNIEVREYGFTKAIQDLCPDGWKKPLGEDWNDVLSIIILKWSPESFLKDTPTLKTENDFHYQFAVQAASLSRRIYKEHGIDLKELEILKTIYLVRIEKNSAISVISPAQQEIIDRLGMSMEI